MLYYNKVNEVNDFRKEDAKCLEDLKVVRLES